MYKRKIKSRLKNRYAGKEKGGKQLIIAAERHTVKRAVQYLA
ncbi:hypothetical protein [Mediterraneibacter massiliensis]|nr:hypothetical protein [Mediterraneibacter massiliensis]